MGRLIDADDVMEMLTNIELSCTVIPINEAKLRLRDIPTAYDINKVIDDFVEAMEIADLDMYGVEKIAEQLKERFCQ